MSTPSSSFLANLPNSTGATSRPASFSPSSPIGGYLSSHPHSIGRFEADFVQLDILGRGTFGQVIKAQNKVDNVAYAIKRIRLKSDSPSAERKIIREVSTLSRLSHPHIVRYYQAWFEDSDARGRVGCTESDDESEVEDVSRGSAFSMDASDDIVFFDDDDANEDVSTTHRDSLADSGISSAKNRRLHSRGNQSVQLTCDMCRTRYEDWEVLLEQWQLVRGALHSYCLCQDCFVGDLQAQGLHSIVPLIRFQPKVPPSPMYSALI
eukprot:Opistho-2@57389